LYADYTTGTEDNPIIIPPRNLIRDKLNRSETTKSIQLCNGEFNSIATGSTVEILGDWKSILILRSPNFDIDGDPSSPMPRTIADTHLSMCHANWRESDLEPCHDTQGGREFIRRTIYIALSRVTGR
jgi:hypothetical protein